MPKYKPDARQSLSRRSSHNNPKADTVLAALQKEETRRLHAHIPASLHKRLKLRAVEQGRDMTAVVVEALSEYLD